jgi:hypothetical protein
MAPTYDLQPMLCLTSSALTSLSTYADCLYAPTPSTTPRRISRAQLLGGWLQFLHPHSLPNCRLLIDPTHLAHVSCNIITLQRPNPHLVVSLLTDTLLLASFDPRPSNLCGCCSEISTGRRLLFDSCGLLPPDPLPTLLRKQTLPLVASTDCTHVTLFSQWISS